MSNLCPECGLDADALPVPEAAAVVDAVAPRLRAAFDGLDPDFVRRRPAPGVWSPLEYAAHLRDAMRYMGWLGNQALTQEGVVDTPAPDPDGAARDARYGELDPGEVLDQLEHQSRRFAARFGTLGDDDLGRSVRQGGSERTVRWVVANAAHEAHHHAFDVERIVAQSDAGGDGPRA